jgi:hypothetical protein
LLNLTAPVRFTVIDAAGPPARAELRGLAAGRLAYLRARRGRPPWRR